MSAAPQAVIVGGGQAGSCAAFALRRAGFEGRIVLAGEEAHMPYERPPLSKATLTETSPKLPALFAAERYAAGAIDLRLASRVESLDLAGQQVALAGGGRLPYDLLLLATGGRARRLGVPGGEHILYLRDYGDALALRERLRPGTRLLCIGAGVIGLEIASTARALGCEVVVAEAAGGIMGRCIAPAEADWLAGLHRAAGVALRLGTGVVAITEAGGVHTVQLSDGSALGADLVVAGVGLVRNTALAEAAGIAVDNGILVDAFGRTDQPGVFAAGDVAAFWHPALGRPMRLESWHHAQDHGTAVGAAMAGELQAYQPVPRFWTDQQGINLQVAGAPAAAATSILRGDRAAGSFTTLHLDGDDRLVGVTTANNARDMRPAMALIRGGTRLDRAALADAAMPLHKLATAVATQPPAAQPQTRR
ncbi:MAG: FAD-dependent oxidoreductase [Pseudomonadota bacterium]